jgi:hypothetical protein
MYLGPSCILRMVGHTRTRYQEEDYIPADSTLFATHSLEPEEEQGLISTPPPYKCQCYYAPSWAQPSHAKSSSRASSDHMPKATRVHQKYAILPNQCLDPYNRMSVRAASPSFYRSTSETSLSSYSTPRRSPLSSRSISRTSSSTTVASSTNHWEDNIDDGVDEGNTSQYLPLWPFIVFIAFVLVTIVVMVWSVCIIVADLMEAFCNHG